MEKNVIERALLCSLFLDQVAILEVVGLLRPEMFSDPDHGFIYEAFTDLFNRNKRPDLILVEEEMKKKDPERYVKMGGMAYLSDGMETVRLEHNAVEYAREILHHYLLGCMHKLFVQKASECLQYGMDYLKVIEDCERDLLRLRVDNSESDSLLPLSEVMKLSIDDHLDRMSRKDDSVRMLTGINGLDGLTGGLYRKEVLVLGGEYVNSDVKTKVIEFNKSSNQYRITVKDYSTYNTNEDWTAGQTRLNSDITSGQMPDIMLLNNMSSYGNYVSKGLLADIGELLKADEELGKLEYLQNVWDAYSVNGKLYAVISSFGVPFYATAVIQF